MILEKHEHAIEKLLKKQNKDSLGFKLSSPSKISTKPSRAFSVPPGLSCVGKTPACNSCYAAKGRHVFKAARRLLAINWLTMKKYESVYDVDQAATDLISLIPKRAEIFRIHEAGDFHSQFSVDIWGRVSSMLPGIYFFAYTRSFNLDFNGLLSNSNTSLLASADNFNIEAAEAFKEKYINYHVKLAYGPFVPGKDKRPANSFFCPATNHKIPVAGACEACKLCAIRGRTNKDVIFIKH